MVASDEFTHVPECDYQKGYSCSNLSRVRERMNTNSLPPTCLTPTSPLWAAPYRDHLLLHMDLSHFAFWVSSWAEEGQCTIKVWCGGGWGGGNFDSHEPCSSPSLPPSCPMAPSRGTALRCFMFQFRFERDGKWRNDTKSVRAQIFHGGLTETWTADLLQYMAATWALHTAFMTYLFYWHGRRAFIKSKATNG